MTAQDGQRRAEPGHAAQAGGARPLVPKGKRMLFCVGAQKGGTTWLAENLARHPECHFFPFEKELHYFDTAYGDAQGMKWFRVNLHMKPMLARLERAEGETFTRVLRRLQGQVDLMKIFRDAPLGARAWMHFLARDAGDATWLCDFTPDYAYCPDAAYAEMAGYRGEAGPPKFLFLMRDPVDRHWSYLRMLLVHRDIPEEEHEQTLRGWLEHDIAHGPIARREYSNYPDTLAKLERHVPEEDRLVLFTEDLFRQETYARVCDFLGIARRAPDFSVVHEGVEAYDIPQDLYPAFRESLAEIYDHVFARWGDAVPERWRRSYP